MSLVKKSFALLTLLALSVTSVGAVESRGTSKKTLSAAEAQVESDILMVQKDIIRTVRWAMEKYIDQDITETGDQKFTFAWTGNDGDANLSVNISKYMSISSLLRGESAVDVVADYTLVVNTKSRKKYDWETEKEVDEPAKNISIVGKVSAEAKVLDDDLYVQLREFTAVATGNDDRMLKDINESVTEITPYIGTTYKLSGMGDGAITQDNILETMDKMMSVLETQPLMTAKKKVKNGYELGFKLSTFQSLNKAMGRKKNAGMNDLKMAGKMIYSKTENGMKIDWKQVTRYTKGEAELTYTNGKYVISGSTVGKWSSKGETSQFYISEDTVSWTARDKNEYSDSTFDLGWENNQLNVFYSQYQSYSKETQSFSMKGLLNPQNNWESNLALSYNGKDVGYIKIAPTGNTVAYDVVLGFDVPQAGNFKIDLKGKGTYEYGLFPVVAPASFIEKKF